MRIVKDNGDFTQTVKLYFPDKAF